MIYDQMIFLRSAYVGRKIAMAMAMVWSFSSLVGQFCRRWMPNNMANIAQDVLAPVQACALSGLIGYAAIFSFPPHVPDGMRPRSLATGTDRSMEQAPLKVD